MLPHRSERQALLPRGRALVREHVWEIGQLLGLGHGVDRRHGREDGEPVQLPLMRQTVMVSLIQVLGRGWEADWSGK